MKKTFKEENEGYIFYTEKHRKACLYLAGKYVKEGLMPPEIIDRMKVHDVDKLSLYMIMDKMSTQKKHQDTQAHHFGNSIIKTDLDYMEAVIDWESARYTKPDKPLNAYDTLYKFYPEYEDQVLPILKKLGIAESNLPMDMEIKEKLDQLNITWDMIYKEMER